MDPIAEESLKELKRIFAWISERERHLDRPITILVGGWAVYSYNGYWGSVDIDLVTNSETKSSLKYHLVTDLGYRVDPETGSSVYKITPSGNVIIDLATRGKDGFEGRREYLDLSFLDGRTKILSLEGQDVIVPDRSSLLIMKMKAAYDRGWRIRNGKSTDPDYDKAKKIKDHSDILALIDPEMGSDELDIGFLGNTFKELPFLLDVLNETSKDSADKYGINAYESLRYIKRLRDLVS